ncbi:MAG: serine--tRNA ligase [Candidatus Marinimicrobia bacterium]|jgi:seryl-tRNA synthetase|nr:serine--tRNA ligase [Candidatus Neomarinimicrobiota bacterium]MBT3961840.1 serine--tRNA ligase [Candidatus Neomarinimicrobiota bacterium]MBT4382668.1 serine--tRNA ligase [Candidatus Neomarinimicrobiota bacterium]MBT4636712.1 serine--tRNA ligase [Candidatus Neomarinimicrobiota bacterium]MBT4685397.1 serine--tRNA ligase [Candidatus Neomarinimicrobiota bacterium]
MISINEIRQNPDKVKQSLSKKGEQIDIEQILSLDASHRKIQFSLDEKRAERNRVSDEIGQIKKSGGHADDAIAAMRKVGDDIKSLEEEESTLKETLSHILLRLPNMPHESVPEGMDETTNVEIRQWGKKPGYSFNPKTHTDLGESLNLFDFKRSSKLSGSGFPLYIGNGAKLERALLSFMLDHHIEKYGYTEIFPPVLLRRSAMTTTGQLPKFEEDMYHTKVDDLYLAPTAEVPVTNIYQGEIIDEKDLPINLVAYSPCFRREAGSYGKDTRGLLRVHQFNKVELVKFVTPESSYNELESLTHQAESVLQALGLHYRVLSLSTGDLSFSAAKCYDIEVWAPGEGKWLEVSSCSNFESFQARRGEIRFRNDETRKVEYLHTLNGSGVATPRLFVALIETYQQEDGSIKFPSDVAHYLGMKEIR